MVSWCKTQAYSRKCIINSACISIMICANPLCWMLSFIPNILFFILLLDEIVYFVVNKSIPKHLVITVAAFLFVFTINIVLSQSDSVVEYFLYFLIMGIFGYHMGCAEFSPRHVVLFCSFIGIALIPYLYTIDFTFDALADTYTREEGGVYGYWMGISYGTLRMFMAMILALSFIKNKKIVIALLVVGLLFYTRLYLLIISRGCVVSIILLLFFITEIKSNYSKKYQLFKVTVIIILILSVIFFDSIVLWLLDILGHWGLDPFFLRKMVDGSMDLSNGRSDIYSIAFKDILENPIIGNGIAAYEDKYHTGYIHNYLIQSFYEMGVFAFIYFLLYFIFGFRFVLRKKLNVETRMFMAFVICTGVIELLFSSIYWRSQIFWFFMGYTSSLLIKKKIHYAHIHSELQHV